MNWVRVSLVAVLVGALLIGAPGLRAFADITNSTGTNVQSGDNRGNTNQGGKSGSGDAVGGQVTGVVSSGRTSVDATNVSKDSSVESGDAHGANTSNSFVGLGKSKEGNLFIGNSADLSFITLNSHANLQEGDNRQTLNQTANASTGDGVAGQVIGVVTAGGGSASVVAANTSNNVAVASGDAHADNASDVFVGLANLDGEGELGVGPSDISNVSAGDDNNIEEGNNRQTVSQSVNSTTGDGVAGQVIGAVSAGASSIDARNTSDNVNVDTGDAHASNSSGTFVGLAFTEGDHIEVNGADISNVVSFDNLNVQEGNNRQTARQSATSTTGDGLTGEVIGAVTSAGGSASIVAANTSRNSDVSTGDALATNGSAVFVGLALGTREVEIGAGDISNVSTSQNANVQEGNNRQTLAQSSTASTGDGAAGQVTGIVSAGATSIDARNTSDNVDIDTGNANASNRSNAFVGSALSRRDEIEVVIPAEISNIDTVLDANVQEGDNRQSASETADASTGDGVGGEVIGAVTSAGGSARIVAVNTSTNSDVSTGDARADTRAGAFVGLANSVADNVEIEPADISGVSSANPNVQDGDNRQTLTQTSTASTGDGVAGQVIGAVSTGRTSIDASNQSDNVDADTGDAHSSNESGAFVGLAYSNGDTDVGTTDVTGVQAPNGLVNVQDGNNRQTLTQSAHASTGDGVAGEVIGAVTSAGGSASIVAANASRDSDASTGDARASNSSDAFVGLDNSDEGIFIEDVSNVSGLDVNAQDGNNRQTLAQTTSAATGDGVAGQVIGVVSAGATSVDARNLSDSVDADSGDADASNSSLTFVGLAGSEARLVVAPTEVSGVSGELANIQEGNNTQTLTQSADASSGDATSGQVLAGVTAGVITGAGGIVSVVVDNTSSNLDSSTGDARFANDDAAFVGEAFVNSDTTVSGLTT